MLASPCDTDVDSVLIDVGKYARKTQLYCVGQYLNRRSEINFFEGPTAFFIFGETYRLKTMVKNAASKNTGFSSNSRLKLENDKRYRKKVRYKSFRACFYSLITYHFFIFHIIKLEKGRKKLQIVSARRGGKAGPIAAWLRRRRSARRC